MNCYVEFGLSIIALLIVAVPHLVQALTPPKHRRRDGTDA